MLCLRWVVAAGVVVAAVSTCTSSLDCSLNGDCVDGACQCDAGWSGNAVCSAMAFDPLDKNNMPGYYNHTESSWGGFPIKNDDGSYALVHAQMANSCDLNSWTSNSIVALSKSTSGRVEGPYAFEREILPPFAHNPTIRRAADGTYVVYFIGGWATNASDCRHRAMASAAVPAASMQSMQSMQPWAAPKHASSPGSCAANATFDPPGSIRVGGDYAEVRLPVGATIQDCAASCCSDSACKAFSFNTDANASVGPICKHKNTAPAPISPNECPVVRGLPNCLSGTVPTPLTCNGRNWPKACGPNMPGPGQDCCGPANAPYTGNAGCGIAIASSKSLAGPWNVTAMHIVDQFDSDEVYCAHTNPSPVFLPNGTVIVAFNAGFCNNNLETIGIAYADHWSGPYRLLAKNAVLRNPDGSPHHCEDPHLWQSERGFHLLTHNQQGPQGVASYGFSLDGRNWTLSPTTPYDCTLNYTDGSTAQASGCGNRPQIVFSESAARGGVPKWLINGAMAAKPGGGAGTWTLFRKVKEA